jgi:hypothetical protein
LQLTTDDQIKADEMGEELTSRREEQNIRNFPSKNLKERVHFSDLDLEVEITFRININVLELGEGLVTEKNLDSLKNAEFLVCLNHLAPKFFFLILAHPVFQM